MPHLTVDSLLLTRQGQWLPAALFQGPAVSLHEDPCPKSPAEAEVMPARLLPQAGPVSKSYNMYTCHLAVHAATSARHTQCIWPREEPLRGGPEDSGSRGGGDRDRKQERAAGAGGFQCSPEAGAG